MRRCLLLLLILITPLLSKGARAAVTVIPNDGCPASEAIDANLERLGALTLLSQLGTAEVRVEGPSLYVSLRDRRGEPIGARAVAAVGDCAGRAALVAAVIAAFVGDWAQTEIARPQPAAPAATRKADAVPAAAPATAEAGGVPAAAAAKLLRPWHAELGVMALGLYDGDVGGFGLGGRVDLGRGAWTLAGLVEGSFDRQQALGDRKSVV